MKTAQMRSMSGEGTTMSLDEKTAIFSTNLGSKLGRLGEVTMSRRELDFHKLFVEHYGVIRDFREEADSPGVAFLAVGPDEEEATALLSAKQDGINAAIIGRHSLADLFLSGDPSLSLRHLAAVVYPMDERKSVRFRLLDLKTPTAFVDENGLNLNAVEAEGMMMVRCGDYAIFAFPTGKDRALWPPWPDDGEAGWRTIPDRHYNADSGLSSREHGGTLIHSMPGPGPLFAHKSLVADNEEPRGKLAVTSADGEISIVVGERALRKGVLVGRYKRCDTGRVPVLANCHISRIHVLVIEIAGRLYAIDTASKNGLWLGETEVKVYPLTFHQKLTLGRNCASMEWLPIH